MKLATIITVLLVVVHTIGSTYAVCSNKGKPCSPGHGACSEAVGLALGGDLDGANNKLFYGKYCGPNNKCTSLAKGKSKLGLGKRGPPGCDGVDNACKQHAACLDRQVQLAGSPSAIDVTERCKCDAGLVAGQATEFVIATSNGPTSTGLCDDNFYQMTVPSGDLLINTLGHQSAFIAAPFCCAVKLYASLGLGGCTSTAEFQQANGFCNQLLPALENAIGKSLCAPPSP